MSLTAKQAADQASKALPSNESKPKHSEDDASESTVEVNDSVLHVLNVLASIKPGDRLASRNVLEVQAASRLSFAYRWFAGENRQHNIKCVEDHLTKVFEALQQRMQIRTKKRQHGNNHVLTSEDVAFLKDMSVRLSQAHQGLQRLGDTYEQTRGGAADVRALATRMQAVVDELDALLKLKVAVCGDAVAKTTHNNTQHTSSSNKSSGSSGLTNSSDTKTQPAKHADTKVLPSKHQSAKAADTKAIESKTSEKSTKAEAKASWASVVANNLLHPANQNPESLLDSFEDGLSDSSLFDSDDDAFMACEPCQQNMKR